MCILYVVIEKSLMLFMFRQSLIKIIMDTYLSANLGFKSLALENVQCVLL